MTVKELNAIKHAAYEAWAQGEEAQELIKANSGVGALSNWQVWRVKQSGGTQAELWTIAANTQINSATLTAHGFKGTVNLEHLFDINLYGKHLDFVGTTGTHYIPSVLESARKNKNLTQSDLAAKIGAYQKDISRWESGTVNPDIESLKKLSIALDCKIDDLV